MDDEEFRDNACLLLAVIVFALIGLLYLYDKGFISYV